MIIKRTGGTFWATGAETHSRVATVRFRILVPLVPSVHSRSPRSPRGFSLLELLIVVALMSILLAAGSGFYRGFGKNVELTSTSQTIAAELRQMQAKAMIGDSGYKWGARFVKNTSGSDYYLLFSTDGTTSTTTATTTLSSGITFSDPASGYKDIIFNKISGTIATATTTSVTLEGTTATITVSTTGAIY